MRFIHCADLHLGAVRFGNDRLTQDFSRSFRRMAEDAVTRCVDVVIICGDLFNRSGANLFTLHEAEQALAMLRDSDIEVIAIEGDHDVCSCGAQTSWLKLLAHRGLVKLLDGPLAPGKPRGWSEDARTGTYLDIDGVRFIGLGYRSRGSASINSLMAEQIEPAEFTVAMMHTGIGQPNDLGSGLRRSEIEMLREKVDYLALGHVHSRYSFDDWAYNPGGLENWRPEECLGKKGYFVVETDGFRARVEAVDSVRRPGHIVQVDVSGLDTDAQVNWVIKAALKEKDIDPSTEPIVSIDLIGRPRLDLSRYDGGMCSWIISLTGAVECLINDRTQRSIFPDCRFNFLAEARSRTSRLTPEETSDLVLRFSSEAMNDGAEGAVGLGTNVPETNNEAPDD